MFSLVYFSVEVCLVGVFPHSASTWRVPCVRVCTHITTPHPHHHLYLMLVLSSNQVVSTLLIIIFSVVVCLRCLLHHIMSLIAYTFWENRDIAFIIIAQFMIRANSRIRFGLYIILSYYHNCANLSEDIEIIKCLSDIFYRVCEWHSAYSLSYPSYNMWGCVFSVYTWTSWTVMVERIHTLSYYHQIGGMNYYPLFRVRSWNNGMCYMSLYIPRFCYETYDLYVFFYIIPSIMAYLGQLKRCFGLVYSVAIWSGIYIAPSGMMRCVPSPGVALVAWAIAAIPALFVALLAAVLAANFPISGGQYDYLGTF